MLEETLHNSVNCYQSISQYTNSWGKNVLKSMSGSNQICLLGYIILEENSYSNMVPQALIASKVRLQKEPASKASSKN